MDMKTSVNKNGWIEYHNQPSIGPVQLLVEETIEEETFRFITTGLGRGRQIHLFAPTTKEERENGTWIKIKYKPFSPVSNIAKKRQVKVLKYKQIDNLADADA